MPHASRVTLHALTFAFLEGADFTGEAGDGLTGEKSLALGKIVLASDGPGGKELGELGWIKMFQQDGHRFVDGGLFGQVLGFHSRSVIFRMNCTGFKIGNGPRYRRGSRSSQVKR